MYVSRKVLIYSLAEGSTFDLPVAERESSRVMELFTKNIHLEYIQRQLYYLNHDACYQTFFISLRTCLSFL